MKQLCQKMFKAIRKGYIKKVDAWIAQGVSVETQLSNGQTLLLYAIAKKQVDIAKLFVKRGAYTESRDDIGRTALLLAVEKNMPEMVQYLLENGANVDARKYGYPYDDYCYWTDSALIIATKSDNYTIVRLLLQYGADAMLHEEWEHGSALHYARDPRIAKLLIANGGDVHDGRSLYGTPLMAAAHCDHYETAKVLLQSGADMYISVNSEGTAAHIAANSGSFSVLKMLLDAGYDVNYKAPRSVSILYFGSIGISDKDMTQLTKLVLKYGYDANIKYKGTTDFLYIAHYIPLKAVKLLIKSGADIHAIDDNGKSVFGRLYHFSKVENIKHLFSLGVTMTSADNESLFTCIEHNLLNILEVFLNNGADIHAKNADGVGLMDYAKSKNNNAAIKLLRKFSKKGL